MEEDIKKNTFSIFLLFILIAIYFNQQVNTA